jgi:hypothetical protein
MHQAAFSGKSMSSKALQAGNDFRCGYGEATKKRLNFTKI